MKYIHPDDPSITWEDGKRGRPPKWVTALRNKDKDVLSVTDKSLFDTAEADPTFKKRQVLTNGTFRINGCVTYVGEDTQLVTAPNSRIAKI